MKGRPWLESHSDIVSNGAQPSVSAPGRILLLSRLDERQGHPQLESHSDIWRPGHGSISSPWEVAVVSNGAQPSVSAPVEFRSAV